MADDALHRQARRAGIETHWKDVWGKAWAVPDDSLAVLLEAMEIPGEPVRAPIAPVLGLDAGQYLTVPWAGPPTLPWRLELENGRSFTGRAEAADGPLSIPQVMPAGYHQLHTEWADKERATSLIVAPARCHLPDPPTTGRPWGLSVQLYGLRTDRDWGLGDFSSLGELAEGAGRQGAGIVGVNPLHALFPTDPGHPSPYSPSSRLYLNPLYIDIEAVPDLANSVAARAVLASSGFRARLAAVRAAPLVDYPGVASLKTEMFDLLWRAFRTELRQGTSERCRAFRRFQAEGGDRLRGFARFHALDAHFRRQEIPRGQWPQGYRDPVSATVAGFAKDHADEIEQIQYLQWEADRQLAASGGRLPIGLYRDLAVGTDPNGADVWGSPASYVTGATIGAPPDLLNRQGQSWGLSAYSPSALFRQGYAPFIAALRANMRHAGALRIDHVMGLKRLYLIPAGADAKQGAYVRFPFTDMLRVLALESQRRECLVVGEDLGTVPAGFRGRMARAGVLSCRVLMFEQTATGRFKPPPAYPTLAAASVGTHDLPPLKSWWFGTDIDQRYAIGQHAEGATPAAEHAIRAGERRRLLDALLRAGTLTPAEAATLLPTADTPAFSLLLVDAIYRFLGTTPAALLLVQPEDILAVTDLTNMPGTTDEHPNWQRRLPVSVKTLLEDETLRSLAHTFAGIVPRRSSHG